MKLRPKEILILAGAAVATLTVGSYVSTFSVAVRAADGSGGSAGTTITTAVSAAEYGAGFCRGYATAREAAARGVEAFRRSVVRPGDRDAPAGTVGSLVAALADVVGIYAVPPPADGSVKVDGLEFGCPFGQAAPESHGERR